jgi:hypothetical protein
MGEERKLYKVLMGEPEGIRIDLGEISLGMCIGFGWLRTRTGGGML